MRAATAIANPAQIVLTQAGAKLVRDSLPADALLVDLGSHRLKDLNRPERVYGLVHPDIATTFPPVIGLDTNPTTCRFRPRAS
jgi:class 3 adenylate cyclase